MITLHHLRVGRSIFTVWLLEELGLDYELKIYLRDPATNRAQADLQAVHPLGKSPLLEIDGFMLAESGAITAYLCDHHDPEGTLAPPRGDRAAWAAHLQWLHYSEGSAFLPLMMKLLGMREQAETPVYTGFAEAETRLHLGHIAAQLGDKPYLMGEALQAPDFGMGFILSLADRVHGLQDHPSLTAYVERLRTRPAFLSAMEKSGG